MDISNSGIERLHDKALRFISKLVDLRLEGVKIKWILTLASKAAFIYAHGLVFTRELINFIKTLRLLLAGELLTATTLLFKYFVYLH